MEKMPEWKPKGNNKLNKTNSKQYKLKRKYAETRTGH